MKPDPLNPKSDWEHVAAVAGALAHEIRNPLSTIRLNLQLLEEDWASPQTPRERRTVRKLRVLQNEVQRLTQTLDEFLRFVRMEPSSLQSVDISVLVGEIAEFIEPELARAGIQLREQYAAGLPLCRANPKLLKQAVLNVILNAQQAMPEGGELILRTSRAGAAVLIEVIDTGPGIPESLRDRLFKPFFSTKNDGSGLGLAITRRIVDQHGGSIDFHSAPDKGTDFLITLPAQPGPTPAP